MLIFNIMMVLFFAGLVTLFFNIFSSVFAEREMKSVIKRRLSHRHDQASSYSYNLDKKYLLTPIFNILKPFNCILIDRLKIRISLENRLVAGRVELRPEQFFSIKLLLCIASTILATFFLGKENVFNAVIIGIFGLFLPDLWLNTKIAQRKAQVARSMPDAVDLLSICVDAGLDFLSAMRWILDKSKPTAFMEELAYMLNEIKIGKPRRDALRDMAKRLDLPDVTAFSRTLIQADKMGTPMSEALSILSEDSRERYFRRAERSALQAPMKMLIPLIFFILPVVAVIVGGPIAIQFMGGSLFGPGSGVGGGAGM